MDLGAAVDGILRDVGLMLRAGGGARVALAVVFGLPLGSLAFAWLGSRLALLSLAVSLGLGAVWALYYATDLWPNRDPTLMTRAATALLVGWLLLVAASLELLWRRRAKRASAADAVTMVS